MSGIDTQEIYTLFGMAVATERGTRRVVGVAAQGHDGMPVRAAARRRRARAQRLLEDGFSDDEIERILEAVPVATHNQRGLGTLYIGATEGSPLEIDARTLLAIVEDSMSSEIYELMKRVDEAAVVEKAHRRPRFVEDCVREMIQGVVARLPDLPDDTLRLSAPGEPRDDPPAQRQRGASGDARRDARGAGERRPLAAAHDAARVARAPKRLTLGASPLDSPAHPEEVVEPGRDGRSTTAT